MAVDFGGRARRLRDALEPLAGGGGHVFEKWTRK